MEKVTVKDESETSSEQKIKKEKVTQATAEDIKKIEKAKPKKEAKQEKGGKQLNIGL